MTLESSIFALSLVVGIWSGVANAHTVITYPGWRGNNLITNETFPYGMQWSYPCGGVALTTNRTNWPLEGGAIAIQPGFFAGHKRALIYINIGFGDSGPGGGPSNLSTPLLKPFQIQGPTNSGYPGTICLPQIPVPQDRGLKIGDTATLQVVETSLHGAAQYNCVDITFSSREDATELNVTNCFNSTDIKFSNPFVDTQAGATGLSASEVGSENGDEDPSAVNDCPVCPTASACPSSNGFGKRDAGGMGVGFGVGALFGGMVGL